jgi:tetratricopeptide (TPR) repeat protein
MPGYDNDIEQILKQGFTRLPVDDTTVEKAVGEVIRCGKAQRGGADTVPFRRTGTQWISALAATLVLCIGIGYLLVRNVSVPDETVVTDDCGKSEQPKVRSVSVVSAVTDSGKRLEQLRFSDGDITTDERSQLLLSVGMRTRAILFERSRMKIDRADSLSTVVAMRHGTVAVDVIPGGGTDTVSVVTPFATFTQIGTRFSVVADSIEGAAVEVYRGKVRVRDRSGTDIVIEAGHSWMSGKKRIIATVSRSESELQGIRRTFADNKMEHLLQWRNGLSRDPVPSPKQPLSAKSRSKRNRVADTAAHADDVLSIIEKAIARNDYRSIESAVARLQDSSAADTIFMKLYYAAEHKITLFRFSDAKRLFGLLANGTSFSKRRREDASLRCFMLHKEQVETTVQELLKMIRRHRKRFAGGIFGDDMTAEAISLLLITRDYRSAVAEMEHLLQRWPRSPHSEYYTYVYASTLRENLQQTQKALAAYKKYMDRYPDGTYGEDALYWIVQLCSETRDRKCVRAYTARYTERYPNGRWTSEIREAAAMAGR